MFFVFLKFVNFYLGR